MIWMRIVAVVIGYVFGLFQTGFIYGKTQGIDIREHGSGNSGATNTLRTLGWKAGVITFAGDCLKAVIAILLVRYIFGDMFTEDVKILEMYAGFGTVLGHNYPFYMNFKGGKGIATTSGICFVVCPQAVPVCFTVFVLCLVLSKYVSLGSILMILMFFIQIFMFNAYGILGIAENNVLEFNILAFLFSALAIYRHRANIVRLAKGTENKVGKKVE
jgi:glycerol-3-phosphate acyltransferase PlsY